MMESLKENKAIGTIIRFYHCADIGEKYIVHEIIGKVYGLEMVSSVVEDFYENDDLVSDLGLFDIVELKIIGYDDGYIGNGGYVPHYVTESKIFERGVE